MARTKSVRGGTYCAGNRGAGRVSSSHQCFSMAWRDTAHREPHATRRLCFYVTFSLCHGDTTMDFPTPELTTVALDLLRCDPSIKLRSHPDDERERLFKTLYEEDGL